MNTNIERAEIARIADALAAACGDDERLFADMLEGETNLHGLVGRLHNGIAEDDERVTGIKARQAELTERKARYERRIAASRHAIADLMAAGRQSKLELAEATFSLRDGKPKLIAADPEALPAEYQTWTVAAKKKEINADYAGVVDLPNWLTREDGKPTLTVRTK